MQFPHKLESICFVPFVMFGLVMASKHEADTLVEKVYRVMTLLPRRVLKNPPKKQTTLFTDQQKKNLPYLLCNNCD